MKLSSKMVTILSIVFPTEMKLLLSRWNASVFRSRVTILLIVHLKMQIGQLVTLHTDNIVSTFIMYAFNAVLDLSYCFHVCNFENDSKPVSQYYFVLPMISFINCLRYLV